mmetsp:Transcript_38489/g.80719  ORF Transcript_38489/g.80719 Transcript_38489/m.80719 type:complete len:215 (-) Transcript_38489:276-920(-)
MQAENLGSTSVHVMPAYSQHSHDLLSYSSRTSSHRQVAESLPNSPLINSQQKVQFWLDCITAPLDTEPHLPSTQQTLHPRKQLFRGQPVVLQGLLFKRGKFNISYKCRFFILTEDGYLHYLISEGRILHPGLKVHAYECTYKGSIFVGKDAEVTDGGIDSEMPTILIRVPQRHGLSSSRTYRIAASTAHEHHLWLHVLTSISTLRHSPGHDRSG